MLVLLAARSVTLSGAGDGLRFYLAPDFSKIKLIDYDFVKYGSSDERKRLLQKWDEEVSTLPQ